ncbi:hypothetical protein FOXYSP1_12303 [Fusarium oxysporum f. sp. phaseoli]
MRTVIAHKVRMIVGVKSKGLQFEVAFYRFMRTHWGLWCVFLNSRYAKLRRQRGTCPTHP